MSCSTFHGTNSFEALANFLLAISFFSEAQVKWCKDNGYIEADGKFNFSDRWSATSNGTMPNGQYLPAVWDDFRHVGLIPEKDLPFGGTNQTQYLNKANLTPERYAKAKQFLEMMIEKDENGKYKINYEWTPVDTGIELSQALKQAPLHVAVTKENPRHSITILRMDKEFESYAPFLRDRNRTIAYALKPVVKFRKDVPTTEPVEFYKPKNFSLKELVSPAVYAKYGEKAWEFFDRRVLVNLQFFRDTFGVTYVNYNGLRYRGFDACEFRKDGASQHNHGRAIDCSFKNYTTAQVIEWLKVSENAAKVPYPDIWVELGVPQFHFDVRYSDKKGVYFFSP
jgi:hypothetical protein